jgi:uncharacterized protein YpbB
MIYKAEAVVAGALNNTEVSRETLEKSGLYEGRRNSTKDEKPSSRKSRDKKKNKQDTKKISLNMLEEGFAIDVIAEKRGLAVSTIEGHMAHFIREGKLDVARFLTRKQIKEIRARARELENPGFGPLKMAFENRYSYGQLKMAAAHMAWKKKEKTAEKDGKDG